MYVVAARTASLGPYGNTDKAWPAARRGRTLLGVETCIPPKERTGATQTTPGLRHASTAPGEGAESAPQQNHSRGAPNVLHLQRLQAGWTRRHLADRFMWMDGPVGVAEAFSGVGSMRFSPSAPTLTRWRLVWWSLLPWEQLHPNWSSCRERPTVVIAFVRRGLTVYTQGDTPVGGRKEARPTQPPPPPCGRTHPNGGRHSAPHSRHCSPTAAGKAFIGGAAHSLAGDGHCCAAPACGPIFSDAP